MPSNAEVYSMLALILVPCLVTAGLVIWERRRRAKERQHPNHKVIQMYADLMTGVETRIQEMTEEEQLKEAA